MKGAVEKHIAASRRWYSLPERCFRVAGDIWTPGFLAHWLRGTFPRSLRRLVWPPSRCDSPPGACCCCTEMRQVASSGQEIWAHDECYDTSSQRQTMVGASSKSGRGICIEIGSRLGDGPSKNSASLFFFLCQPINSHICRERDCSFKVQSLWNIEHSSRKSDGRIWWEIDLRRPFMFTKRVREDLTCRNLF